MSNRTFRIRFNGRTPGAIGVFSHCEEVVKAADAEQAVLSLYERYGDVHLPSVAEVFTVIGYYEDTGQSYIDRVVADDSDHAIRIAFDRTGYNATLVAVLRGELADGDLVADAQDIDKRHPGPSAL